MRRITIIVISLVLMGYMAYSVEPEIGITYGGRSVSDAQIKDEYGSGAVYFPYVALNIWKGLTIGAGYEGGYKKDSTLGIFDEQATLKVTGVEFFIAYQVKLKKFVPYVKLGYGSYSYKQTVESQFADDVDDKKSVVTLGGGFKYYIYKGLYAGGEIRYVPLKVEPVDIEIDLSGLRFSVGVGYTFNIK